MSQFDSKINFSFEKGKLQLRVVCVGHDEPVSVGDVTWSFSQFKLQN